MTKFFLFICAVISILIWRHHRKIKFLKSVTSPKRGEWSERDTILKLLKIGINPKAIFHDCYIKKASGTYTQVDLVVATSQGLLAFEIKDYSGWIFGNYHQKYWTQVLAYGRVKHRFYNPIMQNNSHINAIRHNIPHNPKIPIYNIIVFYGRCKLKNITKNIDNDYVIIYSSEIEKTVKDILSRPKVTFGDKYEIMNVLTQSVSNGTIPEIVRSQRITAHQTERNRPKSTYLHSNPLSRLKRLF